jgi:hypothetical protein
MHIKLLNSKHHHAIPLNVQKIDNTIQLRNSRSAYDLEKAKLLKTTFSFFSWNYSLPVNK